jgi:imidazoleglycerol-phosphate dehydratase
VDVSIGLDGTGQCIAETPVPFLNHMLDVSTGQLLTQAHTPDVTSPRQGSMPSCTAHALFEIAADRHCLAHLQQLASHGLFDVTVRATGDTWIDDHHICEDIALALGGALSQVLSSAPCML